jgi:hypothetical protein
LILHGRGLTRWEGTRLVNGGGINPGESRHFAICERPGRSRGFLYRSGQFEVESTPCPKPQAVAESEVNRMPKFVIEREISGAGKLTPEQLKAVSQTSCGVLREMGPRIQWVQSYVTDNKIYCVYIAPDEATVREHAQKGGFPANKVSQVRVQIDPTTSE